MAPTTRPVSRSVICPSDVAPCAGHCGGETVAARYFSERVEVAPCSFVLAQGWTGVAVVLWHNQALRFLTPASMPAQVSHPAGLVTL